MPEVEEATLDRASFQPEAAPEQAPENAPGAIEASIEQLQEGQLEEYLQDQLNLEDVNLSAAEARQLHALAGLLSPEQQEALGQMVRERGIDSFLVLDANGKNVLENLTELGKGGVINNIREERASEAMDAMLALLADSGEYRQGLSGSCPLASWLRDELEDNPAEFTRLHVELLRDGETTLRSGEVVQLEQDAVEQDLQYVGNQVAEYSEGLRERNIIERVGQASLMEFANGALDYQIHNDTSYGESGAIDGLVDEQIRNFLSAAEGTTMTLDYGSGASVEDRRAAMVETLQERAAEGKDSFVSMLWNEAHSGAAAHQVRIVGFETVDGEEFAIVANTLSATPNEKGELTSGPLSRSLHGENEALERISVEDLRDRLRWVAREGKSTVTDFRGNDALSGDAAHESRPIENRYLPEGAEGEMRHNVTDAYGMTMTWTEIEMMRKLQEKKEEFKPKFTS